MITRDIESILAGYLAMENGSNCGGTRCVLDRAAEAMDAKECLTDVAWQIGLTDAEAWGLMAGWDAYPWFENEYGKLESYQRAREVAVSLKRMFPSKGSHV